MKLMTHKSKLYINTIYFYIIIIILLNFNMVSAFSGERCDSSYNVEPLAEEIYFLELVNRARLDPDAEAQKYNIDLNEGIYSTTLTNEPRQPLAFNLKLYRAALTHSTDMLDNNYFSHYSVSGNFSPYQRAMAEGYRNCSGENIAINMSTALLGISQYIAEYHHKLLFVDKGYTGRGHRLSILEHSHSEAGIAMTSGDYETDRYWPNAIVSTTDFGRGESASYICGVIYDDRNKNEFYDVGEGIPDVTITLLETGEIVKAFAAGAYSLGTSAQGSLSVEANICGTTLSSTKIIEMDSKNVKLDFLYSDFSGDDGTIADDNTSFPDNSNPNGCETVSYTRFITPQSQNELDEAPVRVASERFVLSNSATLEISASFPCYTEPVDIHVALQFPENRIYFIGNDGSMTTDVEPMFFNTTEKQQKIFRYSGIPLAQYTLYWLVKPSNGEKSSKIDLKGELELGYYAFDITAMAEPSATTNHESHLEP
ncbi:hypothetical protein MTBBW1_2320017 [Desulfamplus magnetovallimortis]|uniref:SCP domain-containing protein n=1 Tax=Desulfamplus magnetovallimortis TaxID=1246637 RepID=A0A1W1HDM9_9BACT|nr:CAP domain-containing protein [Desulfamplus magnetovallimortis]SLM30601.1 hypothetical protein MTBBW1_2320017 [Desulfamplus magnetovallimortis]